MQRVEAKKFIVPELRRVVVAGVGGTGGYLVQGLAKLICGYGLSNIDVVLVDPDVVEEKNRFRQNFMPWEIGESKAQTLAFRLNQQYGVDFGAKVAGIEGEVGTYKDRDTLYITCVDKVEPRKSLKNVPFWLDCGNEVDFGQVIFGNSPDKKQCRKQAERLEDDAIIKTLPNAYIKASLGRKKDSKKRSASCADNPFTEQGCFVNEMAAQAALTIVHQILVAGQVQTPGIWFNSRLGRWNPAKISKQYLTI